MAVISKQVSVTTTETLLHTAIGKSKLTIRSVSTLNVFVGPTGLTISNGFQLNEIANSPSKNYGVELSDGSSLFAITSASTGIIHVLVET